MVLTADDIAAPENPADRRSATIRIRSPWLRANESLIPVALYVGTPPVLIDGCVIESIDWSWGAGTDAGVLTVADAGGGTIRLLDPDRRFDPANEESAEVITSIGTRVQVYVAGVPAFTGRVDDVDHDLVVATITVVDDIAALAAITFTETAVPQEGASARVVRILNLAGWPAGLRDITTGGAILQAGTVAADAWSELVEVTRNELGALWIKPSGVIAWRPRASAWAGGTPVAVYGCPPSDAYLTDLATRSDQGALVNELAAARRGGTARTVTDSTSIATYGRRSHVQNDLELASDGDRDLWQDFYLRRQASPARGIAGFASRPGKTATAKTLGLPFGAIVQVTDSGHGPDIDRLARWLGARWTVTPGAVVLSAVTGEDASIRVVDRVLALDLGTDFAAVQVTPAPVNAAAREPGVQVAIVPRKPAGL